MSRTALTLFACALAAGTLYAAPIVTDPGTGHQYQVVTDSSLSWSQANTAAQALGTGWHLVTITSAAEQSFVASLLSGSGQFWAGGFQDPANSAPGDNWQWVTGEPWGYTNWAGNPQEPNDFFGQYSEFRLALDNRNVNGQVRNWSWNDETNDGRDRLGYVAELDPIPEPATLTIWAALAGGAGVCGWMRKRRASA